MKQKERIEMIDIPLEMANFVKRRTLALWTNIRHDRRMSDIAMDCYLQGMQDAAQVFEARRKER